MYPFYHTDLLVEVSEDVVEAMTAAPRREASSRRHMYRHKARYSLDRGDGIEHRSLHFAPSPAELYEEKEGMETLYAALASLLEKQSRRVYAHYILGVNKAKLARDKELDVLFERLYENNVAGKIDDARFSKCPSGTSRSRTKTLRKSKPCGWS